MSFAVFADADEIRCDDKLRSKRRFKSPAAEDENK